MGVRSRTETLRKALMEAGACLVGFADLSCLDSNITKGYSYGIGFALQHDLNVVDNLPNDELYRAMTAMLSEKSNDVYDSATKMIDSWGHNYTRISSGLKAAELPDMREKLPQKTIATLAGLGWIGKSSLLVSPNYGPRIRLGALLTNCPLQADKPILHSNCGDCDLCVKACPVNAVKGANWSQRVDRVYLLDAKMCRVCGLCLKVCPVGR